MGAISTGAPGCSNIVKKEPELVPDEKLGEMPPHDQKDDLIRFQVRVEPDKACARIVDPERNECHIPAEAFPLALRILNEHVASVMAAFVENQRANFERVFVSDQAVDQEARVRRITKYCDNQARASKAERRQERSGRKLRQRPSAPRLRKGRSVVLASLAQI